MEATWQKHERERDQIAAVGGLEFIIENLDKEQDFIEWFLGCPPGPTLRWSGMPVCRYFAPKSWEGSLSDDEIAQRPPALLGRRIKQLDTEPKEEQSMLTEREPEQLVERYRGLIAQLDVAGDETHRTEIRFAANRLRERWKEWQGEDSLHEMAFGEP